MTRIAQSLLTGRIEIGAADVPTSEYAGPAGADHTAVSSPAAREDVEGHDASCDASSWVSGSAVMPGGAQISSFESSASPQPYFRSVAQIGRQAAEALAYAHARGVVHRDVKPANILLDTSGVVWITDFGLAKAEESGLTSTGDVLGTLRYMAPERLRGEGDARADVYALGLTLYELLTLRPAFDSADRLRLMEQIKEHDPPRPRAVDSRITRNLETVVQKAIEKDPNRRYQAAAEMGEDLRRFLDGEPIRARPVGELERAWKWAMRRKALTGLLLLAVVSLFAGTAVSLGFSLQARHYAAVAEARARDAGRRGARGRPGCGRRADGQLAGRRPCGRDRPRRLRPDRGPPARPRGHCRGSRPSPVTAPQHRRMDGRAARAPLHDRRGYHRRPASSSRARTEPWPASSRAAACGNSTWQPEVRSATPPGSSTPPRSSTCLPTGQSS